MTTDLFHSEGVFIAAPELKEKHVLPAPLLMGIRVFTVHCAWQVDA